MTTDLLDKLKAFICGGDDDTTDPVDLIQASLDTIEALTTKNKDQEVFIDTLATYTERLEATLKEHGICLKSQK